MAVFGILISILLPTFQQARADGQFKACRTTLENYGTAMEMYKVDHHEYPLSLDSLAPNYLKELPVCPGKDRSYELQTKESREQFKIVCSSKHPGAEPGSLHYDAKTGVHYVPAKIGWGALTFIAFSFLNLGYLLVVFCSRPIPPKRAGVFLSRYKRLNSASDACWYILSLGLAYGGFFLLKELTGYPILALIGIPLGFVLAWSLTYYGWKVWELLSPAPKRKNESPESDGPALGDGIRSSVILTGWERVAHNLVTIGFPLTTFLCFVCVPIATAVDSSAIRAILLSVAAGALLSFPLYLWGKHWARSLTGRELEWIPGSDLILQHVQGSSRLLGRVDDVDAHGQDHTGYFIKLGNRRYHFKDDKFLVETGLVEP